MLLDFHKWAKGKLTHFQLRVSVWWTHMDGVEKEGSRVEKACTRVKNECYSVKKQCSRVKKNVAGLKKRLGLKKLF